MHARLHSQLLNVWSAISIGCCRVRLVVFFLTQLVDPGQCSDTTGEKRTAHCSIVRGWSTLKTSIIHNDGASSLSPLFLCPPARATGCMHWLAHAYRLKRALARITMICVPLCCARRQSSPRIRWLPTASVSAKGVLELMRTHVAAKERALPQRNKAN